MVYFSTLRVLQYLTVFDCSHSARKGLLASPVLASRCGSSDVRQVGSTARRIVVGSLLKLQSMLDAAQSTSIGPCISINLQSALMLVPIPNTG